MTATDIKKSNNLRRNAVRVGQQLRITTTKPGEGAATLAEAAPVRQAAQSSASSTRKSNSSAGNAKSSTGSAAKATKAAAPTTHKIKNGESLSTISKKYGVTVAQLKAANGMKSDALRAGATLKIPAKTAATKSSSAKKTGTSSKKKSSKKSSKKRR